MKASKVASVVAALLATDAKPTESQILAAILAADKKGKDGLGPEEIEKKDQAKDGNDDPEKTNDEFPEKAEDKAKDKDCAEDDEDMDAEDDIQPKVTEKGNAGKEPAMDAALVQRLLDARDALHAARRDVETTIGIVGMDSAEAVYKAALDHLGVDTAGVHASAYRSMFKMAKDQADAAAKPRLASDAATVTGMRSAIKGYDRLK
jgi:hypothetical protein